jgi:hypothetical protein
MPLFSCKVQSKVITIYDNATIDANTGISTGQYTCCCRYRFVNVFVEFEQHAAQEQPVSLGVTFGFNKTGEMGSRRYFNFEQNFGAPAHPQMITLSGENCWHGTPHNRSSYIARLPVMGPYIQVFPFNHHDQQRQFSIKLYLTT